MCGGLPILRCEKAMRLLGPVCNVSCGVVVVTVGLAAVGGLGWGCAGEGVACAGCRGVAAGFLVGVG